MKNEESLSSVLMRSNSSFFILNSSLIKNYGKRILLSIVMLVLIAYLAVAITAFNRKPADQTCRDMELVIKDTASPASSPKKS